MIKKTHKLNKKNKKNITQKYVGGGLGHTIPMAITIKSWKGLSLAQVFFLVQGPPPDSAPGAPGNCFIIFNLFKGVMNKASSLARGVTLGVGNVVSSTLTGKSAEQKSATALIIDQLIKKDIGLSSTSKEYYGGNEKYYTGGQQINFVTGMLLLPFAPIIMVAEGVSTAARVTADGTVSGLKRITASDSFTSNTNFTAKSVFFIFDIDEKTNTLLYNLGTGYSSPNKYDEKNPGEYFKGLALPMMDERFITNKPYLLDYEKFYRHNQKSKIELIVKPATKETETETILKYWRIENANDIFKLKWRNRITVKESDTIPEEIMTDEIKTQAETPEAWIKAKIPYSYSHPEKIYWRNKFTGIKSDKLPEAFYADENYKELVKKNWKLVDTGDKYTIPETKWENKETGETSKTIPEIIFTEDLKKEANSVDAWIKKIVNPRYNTEIEFYWKNKITGEIARKIPPILLTNELKIESEKAESWVPQITAKEETLSVIWGEPKHYTEYPITNWINIITGEISKDAPVIIKNTKQIKLQKCPSSRRSGGDNTCLINWFGEKSGEVFYDKVQDKLQKEIDKINNQVENIPVSSEDIQLEEKPTENQTAPTAESSKTADTSILSVPDNTGKCAEKQKPHCEDPNNLHPGEDKNACITRRINKKCGKHCIKHVTKKCNKKHDDKHKLEKCIKKHSKKCY
jgi:hypothetical protein